MVEIGVDRGQTSELLLNALPNLTLLGVDPYPGRYNGQVSADRLDQMGAVENMRSLTAELPWLPWLPCFLGLHVSSYVSICFIMFSYVFMAQISLHFLCHVKSFRGGLARCRKVLPLPF